MNEIKSVAMIGAGALGLLYAQALEKISGLELFFVASDERYESIKNGEFIVNGKNHCFDVRNPLGEQRKDCRADLIIVAVKNHHLQSILPIMESCLRKDTTVISVLNGIHSELFLENNISEAKILYCAALGMDAVKEAKSLSYTSSGKLLLGSKGNNPEDTHLIRLIALLGLAGIKYEIPDDIHRLLWWKWMINVGVNQVSAVIGATYRFFQEDRNIQILMEEAMMEAILVAKAEGIDLREKDIGDWYTILNKLGSDGKTSMLQDIENKRKTEVDAFSGVLIDLSKKYGIEVPVNRMLFRLIKAKEQVSGI